MYRSNHIALLFSGLWFAFASAIPRVRFPGNTQMSERLPLKVEFGATHLLVANQDQETQRYFCTSNWDMIDAIVACRDLMRGHVKSFSMIKNPDPEVPGISNVTCNGRESHMGECEYTEEACKTVVTLECTDVAPDIATSLNILQKTLKVKMMTPENLTCSREERCLSESGYLVENLNKSRRLLTFSILVFNMGTADLHPPTTRDTWRWHDCHAHYHSVDELATYELLTEDGVEMGRGHKISFCLRDNFCIYGRKKFYKCEENGLSNVDKQGISVGCGDYYGADLDCQWIDITDVPPGRYMLKILLNPMMLFSELNYDNNETNCYVIINSSGATYDGKCRTLLQH